jgi:hypothetical protein
MVSSVTETYKRGGEDITHNNAGLEHGEEGVSLPLNRGKVPYAGENNAPVNTDRPRRRFEKDDFL